MTEPLAWCDMMDHFDCDESADPIDIDDPTESIDANEPMLPTDANEPTLPIDNIEPADAIDSVEFRDHSDQRLWPERPASSRASSDIGSSGQIGMLMKGEE